MIIPRVVELAEFRPDKMGKTTIASGQTLFVGLNCFEEGQEHAVHTHAGQDKLYFVLQGNAVVRVGEHEESLTSGGAAFARSGELHSIRNPGPGQLVVMAILAPPPQSNG
jgi:mannose-6-phosphate isomerase-like protein (cupin superfamily)